MSDISQEIPLENMHDVMDPLAGAVIGNPHDINIARMFLKAGAQFCKPDPREPVRE